MTFPSEAEYFTSREAASSLPALNAEASGAEEHP
jgi:hypothetical protein